MEVSERLKELEGKASRVPWQIRFGGKDEDSGFCMASKIGNNVVCERWPAAGATEYNPHDPRLIMELVNNLPAIIAALRSCPEMGEVDALVESYSFSSSRQGCKEKFLELADLARRYAAALTEERKRAEEAERLLKDAAAYSDGRIEARAKSGDEDAVKILAICGKEVG